MCHYIVGIDHIENSRSYWKLNHNPLDFNSMLKPVYQAYCKVVSLVASVNLFGVRVEIYGFHGDDPWRFHSLISWRFIEKSVFRSTFFFWHQQSRFNGNLFMVLFLVNKSPIYLHSDVTLTSPTWTRDHSETANNKRMNQFDHIILETCRLDWFGAALQSSIFWANIYI